MSKATCITNQIEFLLQITCKHSLKSITETVLQQRKNSMYLGMGAVNQPSHSSRPTSTSNPFYCLATTFAGEGICWTQEVELPTWLQRSYSSRQLLFSWLPITDPWEGVPLAAHYKNCVMGEDSNKVRTLSIVSKRNVKMRHLQMAPECFSVFSWWRPEERGYLHPLLMSKTINNFLTAHGQANLPVPCRISSPCSQTWRLHSSTTTTSHVSSSDPIWGASTATANMPASGLLISRCSYRA